MKKETPHNWKVTDEQIERALIEASGQPTKAAEILGVDYVTVWRRCRENPRLLEVQKAYRGRTFQHINNLSASAVLAGYMNQPETLENGEVMKDEKGNIIYKQVAVPIHIRLNHGNLLMNLYKGDEGIKDQLEISSENAVDLSDVSDEVLTELAKAGVVKKDEK